MCTAYEIGKRRGSTPGYLNPKAIAALLALPFGVLPRRCRANFFSV
jgi:hypothetical protein